jgi:hemerythrin-like metal-binding protein
MAAINWNNSWSVKIDSIDIQHKNLINLINKFYEDLDITDNKTKLLKLVEGLQQYALLHFNKEENLMIKYNYPDYTNHIKEHKEFINKVNNYIDRLKSEKLIVSIEITNYLKNWIINHISGTDIGYSEFFIKNGVK